MGVGKCVQAPEGKIRKVEWMACVDMAPGPDCQHPIPSNKVEEWDAYVKITGLALWQDPSTEVLPTGGLVPLHQEDGTKYAA